MAKYRTKKKVKINIGDIDDYVGKIILMFSTGTLLSYKVALFNDYVKFLDTVCGKNQGAKSVLFSLIIDYARDYSAGKVKRFEFLNKIKALGFELIDNQPLSFFDNYNHDLDKEGVF